MGDYGIASHSRSNDWDIFDIVDGWKKGNIEKKFEMCDELNAKKVESIKFNSEECRLGQAIIYYYSHG